MLKRWDASANSRCPNCGILNQDTGHLNRCTDKGRRLMLIKCINKIKEWIIENNTYPELIEWVPQYLFRQGKDKFVEHGDMSLLMRRVGATQYNIGWRHFTEGKIAWLLRNLQELWLLSEPTCLTIDAWMRGLIKKLHTSQNTSHHINGTIKLEAKQDVMKEIKHQLDLDLCNLPPENRFLLEIDT